MTVTYSADVATCQTLGGFWKILIRWKGSVYKLIWPDLILWLSLYYCISFTYRFALDEDQRRNFELVALYCNEFNDLIPVSFLLGFFVSEIIRRWWNMWDLLPWPDAVALFVSSSLHGQDERGRVMRRTILRYINLAIVHSMTRFSVRVKKRFPTLDHLVAAGFMTESEKAIFDEMINVRKMQKLYWMPCVWAASILTRARKEGRIKDDQALKTILDHINTVRSQCGKCHHIDIINIPLVYPQVVSIAVYAFFASCLVGRQFLDPSRNYPHHTLDFYIPLFTIFQFMFYMGWLKVAETLINPFGEDDDDFELNWLIDRHIKVSYMIVDEMHSNYPELVRDQYWDEIFPEALPYTPETVEDKNRVLPNSTDDRFIPNYLRATSQESSRMKPGSSSATLMAGSLMSLVSRFFSKDGSSHLSTVLENGDSEELRELEKDSIKSSQTMPSYDMQRSVEPVCIESPSLSSNRATTDTYWKTSQPAPQYNVQRSVEEKPAGIESPVSSPKEAVKEEVLISFAPTPNPQP